MQRLFDRLGARRIKIIGVIALIVGVALLGLSLWGFFKYSHLSMSKRNGSAKTLFYVSFRWINMILGAVFSVGGILLTQISESGDEDEEEEESEENDDLDLPKGL